MAVNYNDGRLVAVEEQKNATLEKVNQVYDSMINQSDKYYQAQVDATKQWEEKQTELQQERTDFTIEQIEQQKDQAHKDYTKEQSASYVDWQKQSNQYGANAEQMASAGLTNAGYGESSQVSMYNTYQNRVATAREVYNRAVLNYDNAIKDAMLQNNSLLAEIAFNSLYQQLEISLAGFQYKNSLIINKLNTQLSVDDSYHGRYMDVLGQINTENSLAEQIRQFNASLAEEQRQYNSSLALQQEQLALQKAKASASGSSGGSYTIKKDNGSGNDEDEVKKTPTKVSTYEEASKALQDAGVTKGDGGLMTEKEWKRRKYAGSKASEMAYSTYQEYLNSFVNWKIYNPDEIGRASCRERV